MSNPYDEFPYRSAPVEWSAPERLALVSLLHGGPRTAVENYRVLELGCGDGSNLLPLAYYRQSAHFVGLDGSASAIAEADARKASLELGNIEFVHADFVAAEASLEGTFDFILAHGVFSWVSDATRDSLFRLCARCLRKDGLLYLNYNALPGWKIRGLVRDFLRARTEPTAALAAQAARARELSGQLAASLTAAPDHPYLKLMQREFQFVLEGDPSYIAHEFLAPHNHAYWRSEFLALAKRHGFHHVADADFNRDSGRVPRQLVEDIEATELGGEGIEDLLDLVTYRQLHSPIFATASWSAQPPARHELDQLYVAAALSPVASETGTTTMLRHASGFEVEVRDATMLRAMTELAAIWPRGRRVQELFGTRSELVDDLRLMHEHGLVELRLTDVASDHPPAAFLNERELAWSGYATTPYHVPYRP